MMQSALEELPLLDYLEYDVVEFRRIVRGLNRKARIFEVSCKTGQGMDSWCVWLLGHCTRTLPGCRPCRRAGLC